MPILETGRRKVWSSRILSEQNLVMQDLKTMMDMDKEGQFVRQIKKAQDVGPGKESVTVMVEGKPVYYEVDKALAEPIKQLGLGGYDFAHAAFRGMRTLSTPFKLGATAGNIPFQVANLLADFPSAALVSKYGIKNPKDALIFTGEYISSLHAAIAGNSALYRRGIDAPIFKGKGFEIYKMGLEGKVLRSTVAAMLNPEALQGYKEIGKAGGTGRVIEGVAGISNALEETFKILGIKRAMKMHGAKSVKELIERNPEAITEIRRYMGSPDFARFGEAMDTANILFMFLNARVQGAARDISRLGSAVKLGPEGKAGRAAWGRMGATVGSSAAALYVYNHEYHAEDLKNVPKRDRENYFIVFLPWKATNPQGDTFQDYVKIPKRETVKLFANSVEATLDAAREDDPEAFKNWAMQMIESLSPINIEGDTATERVESMASTLNPVLRVPIETILPPKGRSYWMHRDLMTRTMADADPREQYHERTPAPYITIAQAMDDKFPDAPDFVRSPIKWEAMTRGMTAGLVSQFVPKKEMRGRPEWMNNYIIRSLGSRFLASGYIADEEDRKWIKKLQREDATETVIGMRQSKKFVNDRVGEVGVKIMKDAFAKYPPVRADGLPDFDNRKMLQRIKDRLFEDYKGVKMRHKILRNLSPKGRAKDIIKQFEAFPQFRGRDGIGLSQLGIDYLSEYKRAGVLTETTAEHIILQLKDKPIERDEEE